MTRPRSFIWTSLFGRSSQQLVYDMDVDTKFTAKHWLEQKRRAS